MPPRPIVSRTSKLPICLDTSATGRSVALARLAGPRQLQQLVDRPLVARKLPVLRGDHAAVGGDQEVGGVVELLLADARRLELAGRPRGGAGDRLDHARPERLERG